MPDLGLPIAYTALSAGVPVYTSDGEDIGRVQHVLADPEVDIFDGLVVDKPGPGHAFVDSEQVDECYERGVLLNLDAAAARSLPEPSENPAAVEVDPADAEESALSRKLRRAWDLISGNY